MSEFQAVIGRETRDQILKMNGSLPDAVIACVGGGSNAIGIFSGFLNDLDPYVRLIGVEAGGRSETPGDHAASLSFGKVGYFHGTRSLYLQQGMGQIQKVHSVSAGLDYPGVGPEHAYLASSGRAQYHSIGDDEALRAFQEIARLEGILPALETAHALAHARLVAGALTQEQSIVICLSGRGDKDAIEVERLLSAHPV